MSERFPSWFRQEIPDTITLERAHLFSESGVHTVCQEAGCPNLNYCFKNLKFTFMILGDVCTRNCRFCNVRKSTDKRGLSLDLDEPLRIAGIVKKLGLNYVVITSVTRDDLEDAGAGIFAKTIERIKAVDKNIKVEALIPDFKGKFLALKCVLDARPSVVAHNLETVRRLCPDLRPMADYELSLNILATIKKIKPELTTKSSLMLGLGETEKEVIQAMEDLRYSQCDILTLGQYLAPSGEHYPVKEFVGIEQFQKYKDIGMALGFKSVFSGPLVRSSYQAEEVYKEVAHA